MKCWFWKLVVVESLDFLLVVLSFCFIFVLKKKPCQKRGRPIRWIKFDWDCSWCTFWPVIHPPGWVPHFEWSTFSQACIWGFSYSSNPWGPWVSPLFLLWRFSDWIGGPPSTWTDVILTRTCPLDLFIGIAIRSHDHCKQLKKGRKHFLPMNPSESVDLSCI